MLKLSDSELAKLLKNTILISEGEINTAIELYHMIKVSPQILQESNIEHGINIFFTAMKEAADIMLTNTAIIGDFSEEELKAFVFCVKVNERTDIDDAILAKILTVYYELGEEQSKTVVDEYNNSKDLPNISLSGAELMSVSGIIEGTEQDKKEKQKVLRGFEEDLLDKVLNKE
jgi:hypothetical protein